MLKDPNVERVIKNYIEPLQKQISMIQIELEALKQKCNIGAVSEWVAVDDATPEHGEEVLTVTEDNWYRITQFGSMGKGKFPSQVTHWMKLPEPPCR